MEPFHHQAARTTKPADGQQRAKPKPVRRKLDPRRGTNPRELSLVPREVVTSRENNHAKTYHLDTPKRDLVCKARRGSSLKPVWSNSLPHQRVQALLTLFSKSFSSFPHGTCKLSVSNLYLALDEIYHPLNAPIPRNATLRKTSVQWHPLHLRGCHPLRPPVPEQFGARATWTRSSSIQLKALRASIFRLSSSRFIRHY